MKVHSIEQQALSAVRNTLGQAGIEALPEHRHSIDDYDFVLCLPKQKQRLCLDYIHSVSASQVGALKKRIVAAAPKGAQAGLVVRRLTSGLLDGCKEAGLCVFDFEGNGYLHVPGLYFERYRPDTLPARQPSAGTGFTGKASRLVRALLSLPELQQGARQAELAAATGLSRGYVSILVDRLVQDGYLSNRFDQLHLEQPDRLLDDWVAHYRFDRHRRLYYALSSKTYEEGLQKLGEQLRAAAVHYAFTAWSGAYLLAPHAEPPLFMAYVEEAPEHLDGIFPVEKGGNVMLLLPQDEGVFQFMNAEHPVGPVVCDAQVYLDLCGMPGRAREQADAFRYERLQFGRK